MAAINNSGSELFVSDISIWEVTLKHSAGKLPLPGSPRKFAHHQFKPLTLAPEAIYLSGELPRVHPALA